MKPAFTPGPWTPTDNWLEKFGYAVYDSEGEEVVALSMDHENIHLIAAAPDLYDVVVRCREVYGKYEALVNEPGAPGELIAMIDAALAKANGETQ